MQLESEKENKASKISAANAVAACIVLCGLLLLADVWTEYCVSEKYIRR